MKGREDRKLPVDEFRQTGVGHVQSQELRGVMVERDNRREITRLVSMVADEAMHGF